MSVFLSTQRHAAFRNSPLQKLQQTILKLVRYPRSLAPTLVTLPSMSLIPFAPFKRRERGVPQPLGLSTADGAPSFRYGAFRRSCCLEVCEVVIESANIVGILESGSKRRRRPQFPLSRFFYSPISGPVRSRSLKRSFLACGQSRFVPAPEPRPPL